MLKTKLLKPRMPYLWELLLAEDHPIPMKRAREKMAEVLDHISDETKVRIYIRIEKEAGPERPKPADAKVSAVAEAKEGK